MIRLGPSCQGSEPLPIRADSRISKSQPLATRMGGGHIAPAPRKRSLFPNETHRKSALNVTLDYFPGPIGRAPISDHNFVRQARLIQQAIKQGLNGVLFVSNWDDDAYFHYAQLTALAWRLSLIHGRDRLPGIRYSHGGADREIAPLGR